MAKKKTAPKAEPKADVKAMEAKGKQVHRSDDGAEDERESYFVNGLAKGLKMIQVMGEREPLITLSEAAQAASMTRASARRILLTLEDLGFVGRRDERHFFLTPRVLSLGYSYLSSFPLWTFAEPVLEELVERVTQTCSIAVLDDTELVYVLRIPVHRLLSQRVTIGSRLPLYCHSAGRILLSGMTPAQLDRYFDSVDLRAHTSATVTDPKQLRRIVADTAKQGYAVVIGEMEHNISGLSVPIRSADGRIIGAMNTSINRPNVKQGAMLDEFLAPLRQAVDKLNASLLATSGRHTRQL